MDARLFVTALDQALVGLVLLAVARSFRARSLDSEHRRASNAFALALVGGAAYGLLTAGQYAAVALFGPLLVAFLVLLYLQVLAGALVLWGFCVYLLYLWRGATRAGAVLAGPVLAIVAAMQYLLTWMEPAGLRVTGWAVVLDLARTPPPAVQVALLASASVLLAILALGYLAVLRHVRTSVHRVRVVVLGCWLLFWAVAYGLVLGFDPDMTTTPYLLAVDACFALMFYLSYRHPDLLVRGSDFPRDRTATDQAPSR